jgi:tRNA-dihydrouridine synthase
MRRCFLQERGVSAIDINMGCPVRKVCRVGGGSAMMTELERTAALVKGMVNALRNPGHGQDAFGLGR